MDPIAVGAIVLTSWWLLRRRRQVEVEVVMVPAEPTYRTRPEDAVPLGAEGATMYQGTTGAIEAVVWPDGTWIGGPN